MLRPLATVLGLAAVAGCGTPSFACDRDGDCGAQGQCEPTGYCSFVDTACASGRRYGRHAPAALAEVCVEVDTTATTTTTTDGPSGTSSADPVTTSTGAPPPASSGTDDASDETSRGDASSTSGESSSGSTTGTPMQVVGPIAIVDDLDDGSMYPGDRTGGGAWLPSGESMAGLAYLGEFPDGLPYWGYFRFTLPSELPFGTTVVAASLTIRGEDLWQWDTTSQGLVILAEHEADAPQVDGLEHRPDTGAVALTTASVRWPPAGGLEWQVGGDNVSPDLAALIQEVIDDRGGLAAGGHVQLWIRAAELGVGNHEVGWHDVSGGPGGAASLRMEIIVDG